MSEYWVGHSTIFVCVSYYHDVVVCDDLNHLFITTSTSCWRLSRYLVSTVFVYVVMLRCVLTGLFFLVAYTSWWRMSEYLVSSVCVFVSLYCDNVVMCINWNCVSFVCLFFVANTGW